VPALRRLLVAAVIVSGAVLAVSGAWLTFNYRPNASIFAEHVDRPLGLARTTHVWTTWVFLVAAAGLAGMEVVRRRLPGAAASGGIVVAALGLVVNGRGLPWDQLGLWAVRADTDYRGIVKAASDDTVRFILIGGMEVGQADYRVVALAHLALGLMAAVLVAMAILYPRLDRPTAPGT
jgi:quinol-cytochrome oxidoreductase complex cytochrome b subunit